MQKFSWNKQSHIQCEERDELMSDFYNSNYQYFDQLDTHTPEYFADYISSLETPEGGVSLDFGCGTGVVSLELAKKGYRSCGVDISGIGIGKAKERAKLLKLDNLAEFKLSNSRGIPYPDSYFDVVGCCSVIEHLSAPEEILSEMNRVLKLGGRLIIICPNYLSPFNDIEDPIDESLKAINQDFIKHILEALLFSWNSYKKMFITILKLLRMNDRLYFFDRCLNLNMKGGDQDAVFLSNPIDITRIISHSIEIEEMCTFGKQPKASFRIISKLPFLKYLGSGCRVYGTKIC